MAFPSSLLRHLRGNSRRHVLPPLLSSVPQLSAASQNPNPHPNPFSPRIPLPLSPHPLTFHAGGISRSFSWYSRSSGPTSDASSSTGAGEGFSTGGDINLDSVLSAEAGTKVFSAAASVPDAVGEAVGGSGGGGVVPDFAIGTLVDLLNGFHDLTGLPWWIIISISTLAIRLSLLPVLILQLKKTARIAELFPKLPPPLPPPLSGRSFHDQYSLFQKKRQELGCPSFFWNFAYFTVQFPCFILWMASIRSMCLRNHPGFDNGGTLWFHNLTDFPHGALGPIFPILVAGLHYLNVQISFQTVHVKHYPGILGLMAQYYKLYLDVLAIPLFLTGYVVPQGSLVYWTTNGLFTVVQASSLNQSKAGARPDNFENSNAALAGQHAQLSFRTDLVRKLLGLPDIKARTGKTTRKFPLESRSMMEGEPSAQLSLANAHDNQNGIGNTTPKIPLEGSLIMEGEVSAESCSPEELLEQALQDLGAGNRDRALPLIRIAIEKNPDLWIPLIGMGETLYSNKLFPEAAECFEHATLKIEEQEPLLVLAYFGAGISRITEGNKEEGIKHLKRLTELKEPDKPINKVCYYRGFVLLGSTLFGEGQKSEAAKFLRLAAAYDPSVDRLVKECEEAMEEDKQKSVVD